MLILIAAFKIRNNTHSHFVATTKNEAQLSNNTTYEY